MARGLAPKSKPSHSFPDDRDQPSGPPCASRPAEFRQAAREIVAWTRAEQGLSPTITDPAVIGRLATMVDGARRGRTS